MKMSNIPTLILIGLGAMIITMSFLGLHRDFTTSRQVMQHNITMKTQIKDLKDRVTFLEQEVAAIRTKPAVPDDLSEFTIDTWISYCANLNQIDTSTVYAIIDVESNFDPKATSSENAQGLMQVLNRYWDHYFNIHPEVITKYGLQNDPYNEYSNILAGCNAYADWRRIAQNNGCTKTEDYLNAYNQGYSYFTTKNKSYSEKVFAAIPLYEAD